MFRLAICAAFALLAPLTALAQEPAQILSRAIAAHGGRDRLLQARSERVALKGTLYLGNTSVPFSSTTFLQLPGQYRSVVEMSPNGRKRTIVQIINGERGRVTIDGQPVPGADLSQSRQALALNTAMRLVPLLDASRYTLKPAGEYNLDGSPVVGILVQSNEGQSLKLFFNRQSGLLMATEHELTGAEGKLVQQARYSMHRDIGGHIRPGKIVMFRNGVKTMEADLVAAERLASLPDAVFHVP